MKFVKNLVNITTDTIGRITIKFFICNRVIEVFKCVFDIVCSILNTLLITRSVLYLSSLRALHSSKERLWDILSVVEIPDISNFIASRTPSRLGEETWYCLGFIFRTFLSGSRLLLLLLLWLFVYSSFERDRTFSQKPLKSCNSSKLLASFGVGTKLKPLLRRRIWGSDRGLPDKLATNDLAQVIQFLRLHK